MNHTIKHKESRKESDPFYFLFCKSYEYAHHTTQRGGTYVDRRNWNHRL